MRGNKEKRTFHRRRVAPYPSSSSQGISGSEPKPLDPSCIHRAYSLPNSFGIPDESATNSSAFMNSMQPHSFSSPVSSADLTTPESDSMALTSQFQSFFNTPDSEHTYDSFESWIQTCSADEISQALFPSI